MSLCTADNLSVAFGKKIILADASFAVQPGDRIGLIGPNGSGKSTLLRILSGEREPDGGELHRARGVRLGYLPQDILALPSGPLVESVRSTVGNRDALAERLARVEEELAEATAPRGPEAAAPGGSDAAGQAELQLELSQRLADLHLELADFDERYGRHRAEEILAGLGFSEADFERPVSILSGGWKMRAALAGLLLLGPDLLLLDEPTNHLDMPSLQWFDAFLKRSKKALVLVSHDRDFLNRQIGRVVSLETEGLRSYTGNYESYRIQRAEEERNLELRARRQAAQRAETERFIERFRAKASKAKQAQSRIRRLEKEEVIQTREVRATVRFRFPESPRSGRDVLRLDGLQKRFGEKVIYKGLSRSLHRGDRVAIIGVNGAGKTTLLKLIAGELPLDGGTVTVGHNVTMAYYAQHHTDTLDPNRTILDEIHGLVPTMSQSAVRAVLGSFLFSGDDVEKPIRVLSGGERARVALARLLVLPSNFLLMDEPTNHLDLDSSERLVEALREYDGTLLFVSHNRSFINQLATKIWDVQQGDLIEWPGNLDEYLASPQWQTAHAAQARSGETHVGATSAVSGWSGSVTAGRIESERERRQREAREREARASKTRPLKAEIASLEKAIATLEAEQKELEPKLSEPGFYDDYARAEPMVARFQENRTRLEELVSRWAERQEALEQIESSPA